MKAENQDAPGKSIQSLRLCPGMNPNPVLQLIREVCKDVSCPPTHTAHAQPRAEESEEINKSLQKER